MILNIHSGYCQEMIILKYTPEEKQKMDLLFSAFGEYIRTHTYFDIVYSEKLGYLRIVPDEKEDLVMKVTGFADAASMLFWDFYSDEEDAREDIPDLAAILSKILPYLNHLPEPERTHCGQILQEIQKQWKP